MTDVEPPASLPEPPIKEGEEKKEEEKSGPPRSSLEDELAALLMDTDAIAEGAKDATKTAIRVRRKSKEINASCEAMWEASQDRKGAADLWRLLGRNRRTSKDDANDLSDEALRKVCWSAVSVAISLIGRRASSDAHASFWWRYLSTLAAYLLLPRHAPVQRIYFSRLFPSPTLFRRRH